MSIWVSLFGSRLKPIYCVVYTKAQLQALTQCSKTNHTSRAIPPSQPFNWSVNTMHPKRQIQQGVTVMPENKQELNLNSSVHLLSAESQWTTTNGWKQLTFFFFFKADSISLCNSSLVFSLNGLFSFLFRISFRHSSPRRLLWPLFLWLISNSTDSSHD